MGKQSDGRLTGMAYDYFAKIIETELYTLQVLQSTPS